MFVFARHTHVTVLFPAQQYFLRFQLYCTKAYFDNKTLFRNAGDQNNLEIL